MNIPKEIIDKAIEGGWDDHQFMQHLCEQPNWYAHLVLDPTFWKALGKSLGWFTEDGRPAAKYINNDPKHTPMDMHIWYAHRFYDLILNEKGFAKMGEPSELDKFWDSLLTNTT